MKFEVKTDCDRKHHTEWGNRDKDMQTLHIPSHEYILTANLLWICWTLHTCRIQETRKRPRIKRIKKNLKIIVEHRWYKKEMGINVMSMRSYMGKYYVEQLILSIF